MTKTKKRILAVALAFSLMFGAVYHSRAFVILGAPAVLGMSAGEMAGALIGVGLAGLIGQQLGMIELPSLKENEPDIRLPLTPLTRDRPVSNPDAPSTLSPTVTVTGSTYQQAIDAYRAWHASQGACDDGYSKSGSYTNVNTASPPYILGESQCILSYYPYTVGRTATSNFPYNNTNSVSSCQVGYILSNGSCLLSNPQAIPDGKADIEAYSPAPGVVSYRFIADDPDQNPALTLSQGAALFKMMHPGLVDGHPASYWEGRNDTPAVHVAIDPSGGTSMCPYQTCIPVPGLPGHFRISALSNTSTGSQVVAIDVNSSTGVVSQANVVPLNGQILKEGQTYINSSGQTSTVQAGQVVVANPSGSTYVQGSAIAVPQVAINTSDLAKTGESAAAAATVVNALNTNLQDVALDSAPAVNSITSALDAMNNNLTPKNENQPVVDFSWIPSLLPGVYTACQPFTFSMNPSFGAATGLTGTGEIDICDKLDLARQILGWLLGVVTVFYIFRVFVQSNKAAL